jgi:cellulose synthase/poly-beta-1,6-N-acetylglucosamine synthase-like glycosyltransferase
MTVVHQIAGALFWLSIGAVAYAYVIYSAVLWIAAGIFGRRADPSPLADEALPFLSVLIAAHNEQAVIERRIQNALELDYPADKFEIVIASDGSTDSTADVCRQFEDRRVRVLDFPVRRGKAGVLSAAMSELRGAIVLLSDANTFTDKSAARLLVRWFADEKVGAVCGRLVLQDSATGKNADGLYWRYETFLKMHESRLGALLGSNGAIYAIRRDLFPQLSPSTIVEDFVIPLLARLRTNCRIIYDAEAVAHEESAPDIQSEFRRRVRIGAGDVQAIKMLWPLLNPRHGWIAFTFFSHKVLRWLGPLFLLTALLTNAALLDLETYQRIGLLQLSGYAMAGVGALVPGGITGGKFLRLCNLFVTMNAALLVGYFSIFFGSASSAWKPTKRSGSDESLTDEAAIVVAEAAE